MEKYAPIIIITTKTKKKKEKRKKRKFATRQNNFILPNFFPFKS